MNDTTASGSEIAAGAWQTAERVRSLRAQANWCVDMAAKVIDPELFRIYVAAATACQGEALSLEGGPGPVNRPAAGVLTYSE